jgi:aminoglycoside 6'-N-acetyltransferase
VSVDEVQFRPAERRDLAQLSAWISAPHVQPWWREDPDAVAVEARYGPALDGRDPTELFIVERDGLPVGMIQRYRLADNPGWRAAMTAAGSPGEAAGIDYFIGDVSLIGQGLGPRLIEQFVAGTWERYPEITAVVVAVQQDNRRSWRALEKAGFGRCWSGIVDSDDPSDNGPSHVYLQFRPGP